MDDPYYAIMVQQSVIYAQVLTMRELQPYETLMYQQLCRALQARYFLMEEIHRKASENEIPRPSAE